MYLAGVFHQGAGDNRDVTRARDEQDPGLCADSEAGWRSNNGVNGPSGKVYPYPMIDAWYGKYGVA